MRFSCDFKSFCSSTLGFSSNLCSDVFLIQFFLIIFDLSFVHPHGILHRVFSQVFFKWLFGFTTIIINKDYYLWKLLLPFGFFSILWIDSWDLFATWSSLSLEISLIGFDVFSKFSFVLSNFLTLFTRYFANFVVSDKVYWSTFLNRGFPCTNQNISFLKFIDKNMQAWIVCKVDTPSDCAGLGQIMPISQLFTT